MNKAFSVLTDDDKRAHYERYGAEGPQINNRPSHHSGGRYHHFDEDDMSAEDIFNMFFGGMPTGKNLISPFLLDEKFSNFHRLWQLLECLYCKNFELG